MTPKKEKYIHVEDEVYDWFGNLVPNVDIISSSGFIFTDRNRSSGSGDGNNLEITSFSFRFRFSTADLLSTRFFCCCCCRARSRRWGFLSSSLTRVCGGLVRPVNLSISTALGSVVVERRQEEIGCGDPSRSLGQSYGWGTSR
jgi:hypothetical protein